MEGGNKKGYIHLYSGEEKGRGGIFFSSLSEVKEGGKKDEISLFCPKGGRPPDRFPLLGGGREGRVQSLFFPFLPWQKGKGGGKKRRTRLQSGPSYKRDEDTGKKRGSPYGSTPFSEAGEENNAETGSRRADGGAPRCARRKKREVPPR